MLFVKHYMSTVYYHTKYMIHFLLYHAYFKLAIFHVYKNREPVASIMSWQQKWPPMAGGES